MTDKKSNDGVEGVKTKEASLDSGGAGISRRNLAKAGAAAPIVLSLFSRPAWGVACSPSSLASGNASGRHQSDCDGNGCTPGFWKNNLLAWQGTGFSPGTGIRWKHGRCVEWNTVGATTFFDVFGFRPAISTSSSSAISLLDVMLEHQQASSEGTYENHLVAALLNAAKAPYIYGATVDEIVELARCAHNGIPYQGHQVTRQELFDLVVRMNEAGSCFLNAHAQCGPGYVEHDGQCIPSCRDGWQFDMTSGQCVKTSEWDDNIHQSP
ncbi:MAG: hypothetical protein ACRBBW_18295 [Cellvibrionaceae bacterium]